ncbi:MAG TPA: hypothetical protein VFC01_23650 [Mycobacterium sp.]|nr:hypothetical protein [Mycobacterium sp.]
MNDGKVGGAPCGSKPERSPFGLVNLYPVMWSITIRTVTARRRR